MIRVLRKVGFLPVREGRRHTVLRRGAVTIVVPRHRGDLPTGTFRAILRQAGLSVEDYLKLR